MGIYIYDQLIQYVGSLLVCLKTVDSYKLNHVTNNSECILGIWSNTMKWVCLKIGYTDIPFFLQSERGLYGILFRPSHVLGFIEELKLVDIATSNPNKNSLVSTFWGCCMSTFLGCFTYRSSYILTKWAGYSMNPQISDDHPSIPGTEHETYWNH